MPEDRDPIPKFAAKIKAKYPQYKDMDDTLLVQKIVTKYPEYKSQVEWEPSVKKKDGTTSSLPSASAVPSTSKKANPFQGIGYVASPEEEKRLSDARRIEEGAIEPVTSGADPLKNVLDPYRKSAVKQLENYQKVRANTSDIQRQQLQPDKSRPKSNVDADQYALGKLKNIEKQAADELFPDGGVAKDVLSEVAKRKGVTIEELPSDNETIAVAKRKALEYDQDAQDIADTNSILDAAIKSKRREDKNFDEQVRVLEEGNPHIRNYKEIIPEALYARVVDEFLSKGNAGKIAENDPDLKGQFDSLKDNGILSQFPSYGANVVANEMSRVREAEGKNNWLGNLPKQEYMDDLAERLYKDDPVKKKIYEEIVRNDLPKYIDTPGFLDRGVASLKHSIKGTGKSIGELIGTQTNEDALRSDLQESSEQVSAAPKGFLHQLSGTGGDFGGLIAYMGLGSGALRGAGMVKNPVAANALMTGATFYGDEMSQARQLYPDDPLRQKLRAGLSTAAFMAANPLLQGMKGLQSRFVQKLSPQIDDTLAKLDQGVISKEAARESLLGEYKKTVDLFKEAAKTNVKGTAEMTALTAFKQGVDKVLGLDSQTYKSVHPDDELVDIAKMTAMGLALPSLAGASGNKRYAKDALYEIASNPKRFNSIADIQSVTNKDFSARFLDVKNDIDFLSSTKELLDEVDLPDKLQKSYLLHSMNERMLQKKADSVTEPTLKKMYTDQIKQSQGAKEKILKGEEVDTIPQETNMANLKENEKFLKEMFDGDETGSWLKKADRDLLGGNKFDKDKVPDYLEFVAMQANNVTKGPDGEIVFDSKFDSRKAAEERFDKEIINAANEMFPEYKKISDQEGDFKEPIVSDKKGVSVIMPKKSDNLNSKTETIEGNDKNKGVGKFTDKDVSELSVKLMKAKGENPKEYKDIEGRMGEPDWYKAVNESKDSVELTEKVKDLSDNELVKSSLEDALSIIKKNTGVKFSKFWTKGAGEALPSGDFTVLPSEYRDAGSFAKAYAHELYHAISLWKLHSDQRFNKEISNIRGRVIDKMGLNRSEIESMKNTDFGANGKMDIYGLLDNNEFVSEIFSNKAFSDKVDKVFVDSESAVSKVFRSLMEALGLKRDRSDKIRKMIRESIGDKLRLEESPELQSSLDAAKKVEGVNGMYEHSPSLIEVAKRYHESKASGGDSELVSSVDKLIKKDVSRGVREEEGRSEEVGEPPVSVPPKSKIHAERPNAELSFRGLQDVANEFSLPDVKSRDRKTDIELRQEARETREEWVESGEYAKKVSDLVIKAESGEVLTDKQRVVLEQHLADVIGKARGLDKTSKEYDAVLKEIKRLKDAGNATRSAAGAALRVPDGGSRPKETVEDFMLEEMDNSKVDTLTEKQKKDVKDLSEKVLKSEKAWKDKRDSMEEERSKSEAQAEVNKIARKPKGGKKDFKAERTALKDRLKQEAKDYLASINKVGIKADGGAEATIISAKMAKTIFEIAKSHVEEGVTKLADVISATLKDAKDIGLNISDRDVRDVVSGKYSEKKTRTQLAIQLQDLKTEQKLRDRLEALENGQKPASEKKQKKINQEIKELRDKIRKYGKENPDSEQSQESRLNEAKARIKRQTEEVLDKIKRGDFAPDKKRAPLKLDEEGIKLKNEYIKAKNEWTYRQMKNLYETESKSDRALRIGAEILNIPRAMMATGDFSALLRQGLIPVASRPTMGAGAAKEMFRGAFSQEKYDRWFHDLQESPRYEEMKQAKLALTDVNNPSLQAREEAFMSNIVQKVPILGTHLVKGSERAYTIALNKMRADLYNMFASSMEKRGLTLDNSPDQYRQMAKYINNATGRGDLGPKWLETAAPFLNALLFSPRLISSRINMLTYLAQPRFYKTVPKEIRAAYFRDMGRLAVTGIGILIMAKLMGAEVEIDPRSSDFGKIKTGNTRYDIWGGFQPYMRVASQMVMGQRKNATTGVVQDLEAGNRGKILATFARGKLSPLASIATDLMAQETVIGKELTTDWDGGKKEVGLGEYLATHLLPLNATAIYEGAQDSGAGGALAIGLAGMFGIGTNTFEPASGNKKKKKAKKSKKD